MQRNWIGKSVGAQIASPTSVGEPIEVFTTRPDTVFGPPTWCWPQSIRWWKN
jgi:leucyl-tRNA synthetase